MKYRSKSTLFLIEQLIVIAVFAICATACIRIVTSAYFYAIDTRDISNALLIAESGADSFKAAAGDFWIAGEMLGGEVDYRDGTTKLVVYYDERWQVAGNEPAQYIMRLTAGQSGTLILRLSSGDLSIEKVGGDVLVSFPIAAIISD